MRREGGRRGAAASLGTAPLNEPQPETAAEGSSFRRLSAIPEDRVREANALTERLRALHRARREFREAQAEVREIEARVAQAREEQTHDEQQVHVHETPEAVDAGATEEGVEATGGGAVLPEFHFGLPRPGFRFGNHDAVFGDPWMEGPPMHTLSGHDEKPWKCVVCFEDVHFHDATRLPCNHIHCHTCIGRNVKSSLGSQPFTPAKCCHVISIDTIKRTAHLTSEERKAYYDKVEELTNPQPKLYCFECARFIPASDRKKRAGECQHCGKKTCKACRQKSHFGPCDQEKLRENRQSEQLVYRLAASNGWKKCPNCLNIVQKRGGCDHMRCNCGQSFCYACGQAVMSGHDCGAGGRGDF